MLIYVQSAHVYTHVYIYAWVSFEVPRNFKAFFGYPIKKLTEFDLNMTNTITRNEVAYSQWNKIGFDWMGSWTGVLESRI